MPACTTRPAGRWLLLLAVLCAVWLVASPALAHKLTVWAEVAGRTVRGEAYFRGLVPAQGAKVDVLAPDGQKLAETTTDAEGKFVFSARYRCDHRLVVNAGEGHGAEYTVKADELPRDLPAYGGASPPAAEPSSAEAEPGAEAEPAVLTQAAPAEAVPATPEEARLKRLIEAAVQQQLHPLERKLVQYQEKIRLSDALGGIGYILGIAGLLFFFLGARKKQSSRTGTP